MKKIKIVAGLFVLFFAFSALAGDEDGNPEEGNQEEGISQEEHYWEELMSRQDWTIPHRTG